MAIRGHSTTPFRGLADRYGRALKKRTSEYRELRKRARWELVGLWLDVVRDSATEAQAAPRKYVVAQRARGIIGWQIWGNKAGSRRRYEQRVRTWAERKIPILRGLYHEVMTGAEGVGRG